MTRTNTYPVFWPNPVCQDHTLGLLNSTLIAAPDAVVAAWVVHSDKVGRLATFKLRKQLGRDWLTDSRLQPLYHCVAVALLAGDRAKFSTAWAQNFGRACCVQAMSRLEVSAAVVGSIPDLRVTYQLTESEKLVYETVKLTAYDGSLPYADFTI